MAYRWLLKIFVLLEEEEEEILFGKKGFHNLGIDIPYILEKLTKNDNYKIKENYIRHIHN